MDLKQIADMLAGLGPGMGVASLAIWFAMKKDQQCTALSDKLTAIAEKVAGSNAQVASSLDALRDAIRMGTRS